ncbi:MAG: hypothetical protein ABFE07_25575 [Armatimonadia bacterium]
MSILAAYGIGKVCGTCGERKPLAQFPEKRYASGAMGHRFQCRVCYNAYMLRRKAALAAGDSASLVAQTGLNRLWRPTQQVAP